MRPGSRSGTSLQRRLAELAGERLELTMTIDGEQRMAGGEPIDVVAAAPAPRTCSASRTTRPPTTPPRRSRRRKRAAPAWRDLPFDERAAVFLRAADLLAGPWRDTLNAATMLGQSKTAHPGRDRRGLRADRLPAVQRALRAADPGRAADSRRRACGTGSTTGPLEGFVYAITPFNFTAIAGNLPSAPALMGNTVVWKPSPTQQLAAHFTMRLFEAAGLPAGVINLVTGDGLAVVRGRAGRPRPGRHPLHRLDRGVPHLSTRSARTSSATAPTRGSSARPAARTSSSPTRRPTRRR